MNSYKLSPSIDVVIKNKSQGRDKILNDIRREYCLKRNTFYPTGPSPNIFIDKLELRMKVYYKTFSTVTP